MKGWYGNTMDTPLLKLYFSFWLFEYVVQQQPLENYNTLIRCVILSVLCNFTVTHTLIRYVIFSVLSNSNYSAHLFSKYSNLIMGILLIFTFICRDIKDDNPDTKQPFPGRNVPLTFLVLVSC